jgi:hypothetical protein
MLNAKDALSSTNMHRHRLIKEFILKACSSARTRTFVELELTTTEQLDLTEKGYKVTKSSMGGFLVDWSRPSVE